MRSVFVNGIEVGKVTEEQYSAMRRTAYRDSRIALVQILNVGYVIMLIVKMLLIIVPLSLFWVTVAMRSSRRNRTRTWCTSSKKPM